jgi:drug/metabolite transporter (DMT)-like permease
MASLNGSSPAPAPSARLGLALMALSGSSYGLIPVFARFAYDAGMTPIGLMATRYTVVSAILLAGQWLMGQPIWLPRGQRSVGIATGILFPAVAYCYLAAINRIPVSLAVLLFFTYPPQVALVAWLRGEPLGRLRALAVMAAFIGLALALGVEIGTLDPIGVALALMGSAAYALMILTLGGAMTRVDPGTLNLTVMVVCALVCVPIALATGELVWPQDGRGLFGLGGVIASYVIGVVAFFAAIKRIGPVRTALLSQIEPVMSIVAALIILKEQISSVQGMGIALLMAALWVLAR